MKNKLFLLIVASLLLVGCNAKKQSSIDDDTSKDTPSVDPVPPEPDWPAGAKKVTLTFLNNADFGTGELSKETPKNNFITAFNKEVNILSGITATGYVQMINNSSKDCYINNTLLFGSRTSEGSLKLSFNYNVIAISVNAQPYWTCYTSQEVLNYSVDQYANLFVQNDQQNVEFGTVELGKEPEKVNKQFELSVSGTKEVTIYNKMNKSDLPDKQGQRSYIHSMEIMYFEE